MATSAAHLRPSEEVGLTVTVTCGVHAYQHSSLRRRDDRDVAAKSEHEQSLSQSDKSVCTCVSTLASGQGEGEDTRHSQGHVSHAQQSAKLPGGG